MEKERKKRKVTLLKRTKIYHRYFMMSDFYKFIFRLILKLSLVIIAIVTVYQMLDYFGIDAIGYLFAFSDYLADHWIWIIFFVSESILGLIPPDLFIVWGDKYAHTYLAVTIMAVLSYIGGLIAYWIGTQIMKNRRISDYMQNKHSNIIVFLRRWGGFLILIAALFPLPYSTATMIAGMVGYKFSRLMFFGLARIVRFYIYALVIFEFV